MSKDGEQDEDNDKSMSAQKLSGHTTNVLDLADPFEVSLDQEDDEEENSRKSAFDGFLPVDLETPDKSTPKEIELVDRQAD